MRFKMKTEKILVLGVCIFLVGFMGCTTTPPDPGSAPVLNKVSVGVSTNDADSVTHLSTITLTDANRSIFIGIDVSDADKDISELKLTIKQNGTGIAINGNPAVIEGSISKFAKGKETYTGTASRINMGDMAGTGFTIETIITDSKGNKSNPLDSDVFTIIQQ
jgi:hypothetical protein